jgi:hypothetical protein
MRPILVHASLALSVAIAARGYAADDASRNSRINLYLQSQQWVNVRSGHDKDAPQTITGARIKLDSGPKETIAVWIADQNPFAYSYKWNGVTTQPTSDFTIARKFAEALGQLPDSMTNFLEPPSGIGEESTPASGDTPAFTVLSPMAALSPANRLFRTKHQYRTGIRAYKEDKIIAAITDKLQPGTIHDLAILLATLVTRINFFQKYIDDSKAYTKGLLSTDAGNGSAAWKTDLDEINKWDPDADAKVADAGFLQVRDARREIIVKLTPPRPEDQPTTQAHYIEPLSKPASALVNLIELLSLEEANINQMLRSEKDFVTDAQLVAKPSEPLGSIVMTASADATATIDVGPANAPDSKQTLTILVSPHNPVVLGVGPAYVYSFAKNPTDSSYAGQKAAFMLTLAPRSWNDYLLSPEVQIGVGPGTDSLGFFFGLGIRAQGLFDFVAGGTYQQFKLATPTATNQSQTSYRWGFFTGVTLDIKANSKSN